MRKLSKRLLRAIAYKLADEAETRAKAIQARNPRLAWRDALNQALADMGGI